MEYKEYSVLEYIAGPLYRIVDPLCRGTTQVWSTECSVLGYIASSLYRLADLLYHSTMEVWSTGVQCAWV